MIDRFEQPLESNSDAGNCCICMEPLENPLHLIRTYCRHCFHPACILAYLDHNAHRPSCPLCRSEDLRLCDRDRAIADVASSIDTSVLAMERCHRSILSHALTRLNVLQHQAANLPTISRLLSTRCRASLHREAAAIRALLSAAATVAAAGRGALLALLDELEACGGDVAVASATACRRQLLVREFAASTGTAAGDRIAAALSDLDALRLPASPSAGASASGRRRRLRSGVQQLLGCRFFAQ